jgi:hypothetical protein
MGDFTLVSFGGGSMPAALITYKENVEVEGINFPYQGLYLADVSPLLNEGGQVSFTIPNYNFTNVFFNKINEVYESEKALGIVKLETLIDPTKGSITILSKKDSNKLTRYMIANQPLTVTFTVYSNDLFAGASCVFNKINTMDSGTLLSMYFGTFEENEIFLAPFDVDEDGDLIWVLVFQEKETISSFGIENGYLTAYYSNGNSNMLGYVIGPRGP